MLGKTEGRKRRGQQKTKWLDGLNDSTDTNMNNLQEIVKNRGAWYAVVQGVAKTGTQLSD